MVLADCAHAQRPGRTIQMDRMGRPMGPASQMAGGDSLQRRDNNEDSITIYYRLFDSSRVLRLDSSIHDFTKRFVLPADHLFLGQLGSAARSVIFTPRMQPGYDPGFHAFDAYHFQLAGTRMFQTTRPYTELEYILGGRAEQTIKVLHTQNVKPLWNVSFEYQLVNMPGQFKNSNSNHSNIRLASSFATKNRRYSGMAVYITNRSKVNENGGILSDTFLTSRNQAFFERFNIPTWLGGDEGFNTNFFSSTLTTGNEYRKRTFYFRHQYDLGQKDSTYTEDSSIVRIFYPRVRLQHNLISQRQSFRFVDINTNSPAYNDIYRQRYGVSILNTPLEMQDQWNELTNEMALVLFPEKNNQDQFLKAGAGWQFLQGQFGPARENFHGGFLLGEYRNRTRNRKWDINANGRFFLTGPYAGDYAASVSLLTDLGQRLGALRVGFQNTNRTPSFVFDPRSNFLVLGNPSYDKENFTALTGDLYIPRLRLKLLGRYYLLSNYTYWRDYIESAQEATLQNVLHLGAEKVFRLSRYWNLYSELHVQQATGNIINVPLVYTRQRLAYEGVFYRNLNLSTGIELRYFSPFTADDYAPFNGQWIVQSDKRISNLPDAAAFLHFRIRSFRVFLRAENLNTLDLSQGFNWLNNNLAAPLYPTPGFLIRVGIYWGFVN